SARFGGNGNSYSGSTAWHNSARSRLALVAHDDGTVELIHEKNNLGKTIAPIRLHWNDHGVLGPVTRVAIADAQASTDAVVLDALKAAVASGATISTATASAFSAACGLEPYMPDHAIPKNDVHR